VKIGGAALDDESVLRKCAHAIVQLAGDGHHNSPLFTAAAER